TLLERLARDGSLLLEQRSYHRSIAPHPHRLARVLLELVNDRLVAGLLEQVRLRVHVPAPGHEDKIVGQYSTHSGPVIGLDRCLIFGSEGSHGGHVIGRRPMASRGAEQQDSTDDGGTGGEKSVQSHSYPSQEKTGRRRS